MGLKRLSRRNMPLWDSFARDVLPHSVGLHAAARGSTTGRGRGTCACTNERVCRSRSPGKTKEAKDGAASGEPERTADGPLEAPEGHGAEAAARPEPTEQAEDTAVDPDAQAAN
jgi:hypothetical protein